ACPFNHMAIGDNITLLIYKKAASLTKADPPFVIGLHYNNRWADPFYDSRKFFRGQGLGIKGNENKKDYPGHQQPVFIHSLTS
ncbi:MAG TPA: hypothetical protein VI387_08315, partial [Candidatus Brocadiales bacterium]|nr:hypothetical protein [Candidatus Brocadiales bacterium]